MGIPKMSVFSVQCRVAPPPRVQVFRHLHQPIDSAKRLLPGEPVLLNIVGGLIFAAQSVVPCVLETNTAFPGEKLWHVTIALPGLHGGLARGLSVTCFPKGKQGLSVADESAGFVAVRTKKLLIVSREMV